MERKAASRDLEVDLRHVADVLSKIKNPWHRYQLTMIIDYYAAKFEAEEATLLKKARAAKRKKTKRKVPAAAKTRGRRK